MVMQLATHSCKGQADSQDRHPRGQCHACLSVPKRTATLCQRAGSTAPLLPSAPRPLVGELRALSCACTHASGIL